MLNSQTLVGNCFQGNQLVVIFVNELPFPSNETNLPIIMHIVSQSKHASETSMCINRHLIFYISS
jgi:hypothetical protein